MVDIHTHILPGVDDGAKDMSQALEMINIEANQGVTDIFVTPHYMKIANYVNSYSDNLLIFDELKTQVKNLNLSVNLHLGNEIYFDKDTVNNIKSKICVPLSKNYILVEFDLDESDYNISEALFNLIAYGYVPIVAHCERYKNIKTMEDYSIMKKMGALIQINAGSVMGSLGSKTTKFIVKLIKNDLVDFIASDVHEFRKNQLKEAYNYLVKKVGKQKTEKIFNNQILF